MPASRLLRRVALVALLCLATGTPVPAGAAGGRTLYVSPRGSDANSGSVHAPLRTPQVAVDRLGAAGGTVRLAGGTYPRQRVLLRHRAHVTLEAAPGAVPVLDETGLAPPAGANGVIDIRDSSAITVRGLTITGYRTTSLDAVPIGIYVTGAGDSITLVGNHVHHLGNDNPTLGSFDMNAHGIAVYGRDPARPISRLTIAGNELDHLVLGASETLVVNGNVDGWAVVGNNIHDDNNIGVDAIGFEPTIGGAARYTDVNRARNGIIAGNRIARIISEGNPAYWEDGEWCNCADGIYVDGGASIVVAGNQVDASDIGIEVAAENGRGRANAVSVIGNTITRSRFTGFATGGYDQLRGEAFDITVAGNTLVGNNTLDDGSPELLIQYYVHQVTITGNTIVATNAAPVLIQRVAPAGSAARNAGLVLDRNHYAGPVPAGQATWTWNGIERRGFAAYQAASHQDRSSTYTRTR
jgi:hypothetical protein